ncbi:MAG: hypothetical protein JXA42_19555, partial [Anaerolineales bacterium]|nr:hypothetical protein [Anaerolineales bacterium]
MNIRNHFRILLFFLILIFPVIVLTSCQQAETETVPEPTRAVSPEVQEELEAKEAAVDETETQNAAEEPAMEESAAEETQQEKAKEQETELQELTIGLGRNLYYGPGTWYFVHGSLGIWEPLVILDNDMVVQPVLATGWEMSEDGKEWTFELRQDVSFHDGTPLNADAVLLNVPSLQEEYENTLPNLESLEKIDDYTVRFIMSEPTPNLPQLIAYFNSAMMSPNSIGDDGRPVAPVGTGPFKFVEYIEGDCIIMERNDDYWGEGPKVDRVIFKYIPDASTRLAALQAGDIDAIA